MRVIKLKNVDGVVNKTNTADDVRVWNGWENLDGKGRIDDKHRFI